MYGPSTIRYGAMLAALVTANGIVGSRAATAFENRLKHLRRNGYPAGARLGKTGRHDYTAEDIVGIAAAIRLIDAFVMPTTAIQMVTSGAPNIAMLALDVIVPASLPPARPADGAENGGGGDVSVSGPVGPTGGEGDRRDGAPTPFAPRAYALFRGSALSELGEREAGAGRYEAPVGDVVLLSARDIRDANLFGAASGVILNGPATFGPLVEELGKRGLGARALAAGLLSSLSTDEAAAADADVARASTEARRGLWHLSMLLRALQGSAHVETISGRVRIAAHHAHLLLHEDVCGAAAAMAIGGGSGATVTETVLALLDRIDFPEIVAPTGWPVTRFLELAREAGLPPDDPDALRRRLLEQVPLLAEASRTKN